MKYLLIILLVFVSFACNSPKSKEQSTNTSATTISFDEAEEKETEEEQEEENTSENYPSQDYQPNFGIELLLNGKSFELSERNSLSPYLFTKKWSILSYNSEQKSFWIEETRVDTSHFYWDCGGYDMFWVQPSQSRGKGLAFVTGIDNIGEGKVKTHFHNQVFIEPSKPYHFEFEGVRYTLRAEGDLEYEYHRTEEDLLNSDGRLDNSGVYQNYKLYLSSNDVEQLLLDIKSFSDQYVKFEFVGDLDGDNKPDFIFETATWYEDQEIMLFLSSKAKAGELVKFVAKDGYSMAC